MIEGLILGVLSWLSFLLSWLKLPKRVKMFCLRHPVLTDFGAGLLAFVLLSSISKSLVAVIGAMLTGLLVNFTIYFGAKPYANQLQQQDKKRAMGSR